MSGSPPDAPGIEAVPADLWQALWVAVDAVAATPGDDVASWGGGKQVGTTKDDKPVLQMPYVSYAEAVNQLMKAAAAFRPFVASEDSAGEIEPARLLRRAMTTCRSERFVTGAVASALANGRLLDDLKRVRDWHSQMPEVSTSAPQAVDVFEDVLRTFGRSIMVKRELLSRPELSSPQRAQIRSSMTVDLRKCCDVLTPDLRQPLVSAEAAAVAQSLGVSLSAQTWHTQKSFDPAREIFHFEHLHPVAGVVDSLAGATDLDAVCLQLKKRLWVAWILKSQDKALTALGFKTVRPDPLAAYEKAGISLILPPPDPDGQNWIF